MTLDLRARHIVVTGGTGALGSAVVDLLLRSGATCHITSLKPEELTRFPFKDHKDVRIQTGVELTDESAVESFYSRFNSSTPLWASVHIAGGFAMAATESISKSDFVSMMQGNALSCFLCCREAVKKMKTGGVAGSGGGRIVNVAARAALIPELGAGMVPYTASKAAVAAITQALAAEVASAGILVNAVVPSIMDTPANRKAMPDADHAKWPKVHEVAATIAFLASPDNQVTRGALVPVYGRS
jgi:NAD(P)-dependent dehydrogenase (short-subunit alcohol dehydrogenase family)